MFPEYRVQHGRSAVGMCTQKSVSTSSDIIICFFADMHAESTVTDTHPRPEASHPAKVTGERSHGKVTGDGERPGTKTSTDNVHSAHQQPDKNGDAPTQNENTPKSLHSNTQGG